MFWNDSTATTDDRETGVKLCPYCAEEIQSAAIKCKHCHSWIGGPHGGPSGLRGDGKPTFRLTRSVVDRKVYGVCGGIGRMLGIDPTLVRVAFALAAIFTMGAGVVAYLVMAYVIPNEEDVA